MRYIYIPEINLAIEIDGYPWHQGYEERDIRKNKHFIENNIYLLRVRDNRLNRISNDDVFYSSTQHHAKIIANCFNGILNSVALTSSAANSLKSYIDARTIQNEGDYKKILSFLPGPPEELSFGKLYPELANEWSISKNQPLVPTMFSAFSHKKVWWQCEREHVWEASLAHRASGRGCPTCAYEQRGIRTREAAKLRGGSFRDNNPEISAEWHVEKNGDLTPNDLSSGSSENVWWKCSMGHEWEARIVDRTKGSGCPTCANKTIGQKIISSAVRRSGSLKNANSRVALEWHVEKNGDLTPNDLSAGSSKKVWWKCSMGHEWEATVKSRTAGHGCPLCYGNKRGELVRRGAIRRSGSLIEKYPIVAKQWDNKKNQGTPNDVPPFSDKKVWWVCENGHEWEARIASRTKGSGCPKCYKEKRTRRT